MESKHQAVAALALAIVLALGWSTVQVVERRRQATLDNVVGAAFLSQAAAQAVPRPTDPPSPVAVPDLTVGDTGRRPPGIAHVEPAVEGPVARPVAAAVVRNEDGKSGAEPGSNGQVVRAAPAAATRAKAARKPHGIAAARSAAAANKSVASKKVPPPLASTTPAARRASACAGTAPPRAGCVKPLPGRPAR